MKSSQNQFLDSVNSINVGSSSPFYLEEITKGGNSTVSTCESSVSRWKFQVSIQKLWHQRPGCLNVIHGCVREDKHILETVANVLTSLPFIALGFQVPRKSMSSNLYANSLIGVGITSALYHSSKGNLKKYFKWLDYTMIATATVCLSNALQIENPKLLTAASAALLPIQPLMVSALHTGMMEITFSKRVLEDPELRMAHNVHKMSTLIGGALFIAEDVFPTTPYIHAGWHLAAAIGIATSNKLLK